MAGLTRTELDGRSHWISLQQFEMMLASARGLLDDDQQFKDACGYELKDSWGAIRFAMLATSVGLVYEMSSKTITMVSAISAYSSERTSRNSLTMRYTTTRVESRLMCLSRHGALTAMPMIFGLPRAQLSETSCVARGDAFCSYHLRWYEQRRWLPNLLGAALGLALALALGQLSRTVPLWASLPLLGWAAGHIYELRRTNRANLLLGEEINEALRVALRDDVEARQEILELQQRQQQWARLMEQQVADRTATLSEVVEGIQQLQKQRMSTLLGFSHDLRSPLAALTMNASMLREYIEDSPEARELVDDLEGSSKRMMTMLEELVATAKAERGFEQIAPQPLEVPPLVDRLRRRLRALTHGRDVRISAFATREAPDRIETDTLVFDRVVDNLLTNAAKYTERGSIVVEVGGLPGFLTIKVSDTGKGIESIDIERIFQVDGSDQAKRAPHSFGVGLSVAVQLLAQIGGRLEVMSKSNFGTTFWAHFPIQAPSPARTVTPGQGEIFQSVVTIRKAQGA